MRFCIFFFLLPFVLITAQVLAQTQPPLVRPAQPPPPSDSVLAQRIKNVSGSLELSAAQSQHLFSIEKKLFSYMDSLAHSGTSPDTRKAAMTAALADHDRQLRQLFNDKQWKMYTDMLETRKAALQKAASGKHITVHEIPRQQP